MSTVLVLNADLQPLHRVSEHHAIRMLIRKVAKIEEREEGATFGPFPKPRVLSLIRYVVTRWRYGKAPNWSKAGVHLRDKRCAYCPTGKAETVDHILPRAQGGTSGWKNTVSCCERCNARKGPRTPEQAGMPLLLTPYIPKAALNCMD